MRKAQITIFIVLGIVILIIFGLLFFIRNATSGVVLEKKINKIYEDFLESTDIKHVTQDCLDKTTKEALLLVGLQGGRIYDYQINKGYNITSFYDVVPFNYTGIDPNGTIYNVSYGIKAPVNILYPEPPDYPYPGSLVRDISELYTSSGLLDLNPYDKVFSEVLSLKKSTILTDLCNEGGPNDPNIVGAKVTCEKSYSKKNESIQEYIKQYIEQDVKDCINFTLKEVSEYIIFGGKLSATVLMGEDDLLVSLTYPIEISIKGKPPITKYLNFNIRPKIRLKIVYEVATHLIGYDPFGLDRYHSADSNNIFFKITEDDPKDCYGGSSPCIVYGINVSRLKDYCLNNYHCNFNNSHYNYSDIIVIRDNQSVIDGKPYMFMFAIENRRPTLDYIDENVSSDKYYFWYINATYNEKNLTKVYSNVSGSPASDDYNIIVETPAFFEIFPLGIDPDEDNLTYNYSVVSSPSPFEWTTDTFQYSDVTYYNGSFYPRSNVTGFESDHAEAKDALVQVGGAIDDPFIDNIDNIVRINVSDNEGLYDYQDVIIRIIP